GEIGEGVAAIAGAVVREVGSQAFVTTHDVVRDLVDLGRVQHTGRRIDRKFLEDTVLFQNRRFADSEEQVGYALAAADHRGKQSIYELFIHESRRSRLELARNVPGAAA